MRLFSDPEAQALQQALSLLNHEQEPCSLEQLHGFIFGLIVTPVNIETVEWRPFICKNIDEETVHSKQQRESLTKIDQSMQKMKQQLKDKQCQFPFQYQQPSGIQIQQMIQWCSGLQAALMLRSPLWLGEDKTINTEEEKQKFKEMAYCFTSLRAITQPSDIPTLFGQHLENPNDMDDEEQIRLFVKCLQSMPHLVQSLIHFSEKGQSNNNTVH